MKTIGRILIILTALAIVMGITYVPVNVGGASSSGAPQFENRERPFPSNGQFEGRPEGREEGGGRWMFGLTKNLGVIAILVTAIVLPKSIGRKKKRSKPALAD